MKNKLIRGLLYCGALAFAFMPVFAMLPGCASGTSMNVSTDGQNIDGGFTYPVSSNVDVSVTGGGNTVTGDWHAGVSITFKQAPPEYVVKELVAAGAVAVKDKLVWQLSSEDVGSLKAQRAIHTALTVPGTVVTARGDK